MDMKSAMQLVQFKTHGLFALEFQGLLARRQVVRQLVVEHEALVMT
jgi:hypothetical protein